MGFLVRALPSFNTFADVHPVNRSSPIIQATDPLSLFRQRQSASWFSSDLDFSIWISCSCALYASPVRFRWLVFARLTRRRPSSVLRPALIPKPCAMWAVFRQVRKLRIRQRTPRASRPSVPSCGGSKSPTGVCSLDLLRACFLKASFELSSPRIMPTKPSSS
jgi:hypothetical protein